MYLVYGHKKHKPRARMMRAGLMPAKICAALMAMRANLRDAPGFFDLLGPFETLASAEPLELSRLSEPRDLSKFFDMTDHRLPPGPSLARWVTTLYIVEYSFCLNS
jgi:hypothetical protein